MKSTFAAIVMALSVSLWSAVAAEADTAGEVRILCDQFRTAQNARDLAKVRTLLIDSPQWVSDGETFRGPEAPIRDGMSGQASVLLSERIVVRGANRFATERIARSPMGVYIEG
jgi:hypothetical protein